MCKTKCIECKECLIEISSIKKDGQLEGHINKFGDLVMYNKTVSAKSYTNISFCKTCKVFYDSFELEYEDTTKDYFAMDVITLDIALSMLSDILLYNPECINFKNLKEVFSILKIDSDKAIKSIAYNIVNKDKPSIDIIDDEELPF